MKAQLLYDVREETGLISGDALHDLFVLLCGDPSPRGATEVDTSRLRVGDEDWSPCFHQLVGAAIAREEGRA